MEELSHFVCLQGHLTQTQPVVVLSCHMMDSSLPLAEWKKKNLWRIKSFFLCLVPIWYQDCILQSNVSHLPHYLSSRLSLSQWPGRRASAQGVFVLTQLWTMWLPCLLIMLIQIQIYRLLLQIWVTDQFRMKLSDSSAALADDRIEQKYKGDTRKK